MMNNSKDLKHIKLDRKVEYKRFPPFPNNIMMELTNACNHKCSFCGNRSQSRRIKTCEKDLFFRLLEEAYDLGSREVGFYLNGEPFMCVDLLDYVRKANNVDGESNGYEYIYITTNGALATADKVKELVENGLSSIKFSVNAGTKETYLRIHGVDDFDRVLKNIIQIREMLQIDGYDCGLFVSFIITDENCGEVDLVNRIFEDVVDEIQFVQESNQQGYNTNTQTNIYDKIPCDYIFNRAHITSEGYLDACCIDYSNMLAVADLHNMTLLDAWNSDIFVQLREQHLRGTLGNNQCKCCVYSTSFSECKPINPLLSYSENAKGGQP